MRTNSWLAAGMVLACAFSASAQTTSTSILGTVTDSSGSVVSGAKVVITNVRTGLTADTFTTSSGDYTFPLIDVGEYKVDVTMQGFKSATRTAVNVQINEKVRVDFKLDVGQVSERVEVTAAAATLQTDEVSLGTAVEQRRLVELPVNGRNVGNLAVLQAGVMFGPGRQGVDGIGGTGGGIPIPGQTIALVANGQRETNQHATLDGVVATEARVNTVPFSPSPEAMEEVKVLTGSYSAEYGFNSGAQLVMVMRSGTNQFHGAAYEFFQNDKLNAEDYFQNYFLAPGARRVPKQQVRQNQFGAVLGGPVWIPGLYNGKNRTFFMFNYEGRRRRLPGATGSALVPSDAMRNGDFSALLNIPNPVQLVDPINGQPFAGNIIPQNRITATARALNSFWERPQTVLANPLVGFNYVGVGGQQIDDDQYYVKADHNFTEHDKIMFRYATNIPFWNQIPGASPQFTYRVVGRNNNYAGQWLHIFTPTIINEFRYGYAQSRSDSFNPRANTNFDLSAIGLDSFRVINDGNRKLTPREVGVPSMNIQGFQGLSERDGGNGFDNNQAHIFGNNVSITFSKHTVKFGGEFRRLSLFRGAANVPRGSFDFTNAVTGNAYAAFLLGVPASTNTPEGLPLTDVRQNRMGLYLQDDWKATRNLTVNLGLRWEYNSTATDVQGLWRSLEWRNGLNNPPEFVPGQIRNKYEFYKPQKDLFMPRIGLAYRLSDAWVMRAGWGIYYNVHQLNNYTILNLNPPLSGSTNFNNQTAGGALINPAGGFFSFGNPFGVLNPASAISANVLNTDNFQPMVNQWSFDIQRRLTSTMTLAVGYVGSKTTHLDNTVELNSPDPAFNTAASTLQSRRPIQFVIDNGVRRPLTRLRWLDSGANAWYQGLQTTLQKRYSNGLSMTVAYTWSKSLMEGYGRNEGDGFNPNTYQNPRNRFVEKGRAGFDATHNLVANFVYDIPVMENMKKGVAGYVFNGWQTNGILTFRTGFPFTVTQAGLINTANTPVRPDRLANGSLANAAIDRWFDVGAFRQVTCQDPTRSDLCKYGNSGNGILEGPGFKNVDFSLFKNFIFSESWRLQFRSEFFNLFNTPQFGRPNANLGAANPGRVTGIASPMRQIQLGLKLIW